MFIKKMQINNFMKYRDTTFELHPDMILLVGGNNSGKTTLLNEILTFSRL